MKEAFGYANIEWKRGIDWDAVRAFRLERAQRRDGSATASARCS